MEIRSRIPRYRYQVLVNGVDEYLKIKLDEIRKYHPEIEYIERNFTGPCAHRGNFSAEVQHSERGTIKVCSFFNETKTKEQV